MKPASHDELPQKDRSRPAAQEKPLDAADPKITRRRAFKKFVAYTAPAVLALMTARDAAGY